MDRKTPYLAFLSVCICGKDFEENTSGTNGIGNRYTMKRIGELRLSGIDAQ